MTSSFLMEYIPDRMKELGYGTNYRVTMRTLNLPPNGTLEIKAYNRYLYFPFDLLGYSWSLEIESNFGYYNRTGTHNEQAYEHTGLVKLTNPVLFSSSVTFFEVVPILQPTKPQTTTNANN